MPYSKHVYVLVFDGFDDHGVSLALRVLRDTEGLQIITAGLDRHSVTSASGLRVLPDIDCGDIHLECAALFVLPAGGLWTQPGRNAAFDPVTACTTEMLHDFNAAGVRIAAIGSAVTALARAGMLAGVSHTSDSPIHLALAVPGLAPSPFYVATSAISDENIITANAAAPAEFAREIASQLAIDENALPSKRQAA